MFSARIGFFSGTAAAAPQDILMAYSNSPYVLSYQWTDASGYGTKYANPATVATSTGRGVEFTTDNSVAFLAVLNTPWMNAWAYTVGTGFGTKYSNPGTLGGANPETLAWNNSTSSIMESDGTSPYLNAWAWSGGFGTKYSNPGTAIGASTDDVIFSRAGNVVFTGPNVSPFIVAYAWSSSGFGTKFANPATLPSAEAMGIDVGYSDNFIAYGTSTTQLRTLAWDNTTGWGTVISTAAVLSDDVQGLQLNSTGTTLFVALNTTLPRAYAIDSGGILGSFTSASATADTYRGVGANLKTGAAVVFGLQGSPGQQSFPFSGTTFGTQYSAPSTPLINGSRDVVFSN